MKSIFDTYCFEASKLVTKSYSTSFFAGVKSLDKKIQPDIHAIYGLVRFADEIVDSFHDFDKEILLKEFKEATFTAIERKISLNPILNSFQATVNKYEIDHQLIEQFFISMEMDLKPVEYCNDKYEEYILGSARVVGLMCLKVFVYGNEAEYQRLKPSAMKLGSAFQKINFLRDLKSDMDTLGRVYFPNLENGKITENDKLFIEKEIKGEFDEALIGIKDLPKSARFGVYLSYTYYTCLLQKIKTKSTDELMQARIRISDFHKFFLTIKAYIKNQLNLI